MKIQRPRIVTHTIAGILPSGHPHTVAAVTQTEMDNLVLGNGAVHTIIDADGITTVTETSLALPNAAGAPATFIFPGEFNCKGSTRVFLNIHAISLVGSASLDVIIEFQSPHYAAQWTPSADGIARNINRAGHIINIAAAGNYLLQTRVETPHFEKVRFGFGGNGAAAAGTEIWVTWFTDGQPSLLPDVTN